MSRIVRGSEKHIAPIAKLMVASPLLQRYGVTARGARASLGKGLRRRDTIFVALEGAMVVGLGWFIKTPALDRAMYLRLLVVAESHQSRGVGALLLARGEREALVAGCRHMILLVTKSNRRARAFYERHGYERVGVMRGFVRSEIDEALYLKSWRA